jgi:hypothetical protein
VGPIDAYRLSPRLLLNISALRSLAADTSLIACGTGLVDAGIRANVARGTGLIDSRVPPDIARGAGLVDAGVRPDVARWTGLVDSSVTRVQRAGQGGDHRTHNKKGQHEKRCHFHPVRSIVTHFFSPFDGWFCYLRTIDDLVKSRPKMVS